MRVKFFKAYSMEDDRGYVESLVGEPVSEWLEIDPKYKHQVYAYLAKKHVGYHGGFREHLVMVEELGYTQEDMHITIEKIKEAEEAAKKAAEKRKLKTLEKKAKKKELEKELGVQ